MHEALAMGADVRRERSARLAAAAVAMPPRDWLRAQIDSL
jgi:trehalose 6-phosphate synthase